MIEFMEGKGNGELLGVVLAQQYFPFAALPRAAFSIQHNFTGSFLVDLVSPIESRVSATPSQIGVPRKRLGLSGVRQWLESAL